MSKYFAQNNWEPFVYQRLNQLIDQFKSDENVAFEEKSYVVFDFDNTSVIGDIEDNLMVYMLDHLLYKMTPDEFYQVLVCGEFPMEKPLDSNFTDATPQNLATDIRDGYRYLYDHYINAKPAQNLDQVKLTDTYKAFQAKLRFYYTQVNGKFTRMAGKPWLTYWFKGYTPQELHQLTADMLEESLAKKPTRHTYSTPVGFEGLAGSVTSSYQSGLVYPQELIDLYSAFQNNGIVTYVVSASPYEVVVTGAADYQLNVPKDQVIGMQYTLDEEGYINSHMAPNSHITKKEGKTSAILEIIAPNHQNRQPIALFGDSMGDFDMMTKLSQVSLNVLFNCLNDDQTKDLKKLAQDQYNQLDAQFVVQGRDENLLQLIPNVGTILLGESQVIV